MEENKNQNNENNPNNNGKKSPNRSFLFMLIVSIGLTLLFFYAYSSYQTSQQEEISYSEFLTMLDEGKVESVKIYSSTVEVIPKEKAKSGKKKSYVAIRISDIDLVPINAAMPRPVSIHIIYVNVRGARCWKREYRNSPRVMARNADP